EAGRRADVVLAIGARFDDRSASSWLPGYSWNFPVTKLIHVDVDAAELGRNYPPDLPIAADARTFLRQLLTEPERRAGNGGGTARRGGGGGNAPRGAGVGGSVAPHFLCNPRHPPPRTRGLPSSAGRV